METTQAWNPSSRLCHRIQANMQLLSVSEHQKASQDFSIHFQLGYVMLEGKISVPLKDPASTTTTAWVYNIYLSQATLRLSQRCEWKTNVPGELLRDSRAAPEPLYGSSAALRVDFVTN